MTKFTPNFDVDSNFNSVNSYSRIRFAKGTPLLETELNELQQIQNHKRKSILTNLYEGKSGIKSGDFRYDKTAQKLVYTDLVLLSNGDFYELGSGEITAKLNQTVTLKHMETLIRSDSEVYVQGNVTRNEKLVNKIVDSRVGEETSRRYQSQFQFNAYDGKVQNIPSDELSFIYIDIDGELKTLMDEITVDSSVTIDPLYETSKLTEYPLGTSNFSLDNIKTYDDLGVLVTSGKAEKYGYSIIVMLGLRDYEAINIVTEKFVNGYATQYAYLDNAQTYFRESVDGYNFKSWKQIVDSDTMQAYKDKVDKQVLDLTLEVAILNSANTSGINSNIIVETFKDLDDIELISGKYDATNKRIYLSY